MNELERVIRDAGEGWLIDSFEPREDAINHIRDLLEKVTQLANSKLPGRGVNVREEILVLEYSRTPLRVRGFLQVLGSTKSAEMLLMAWRIIQGMEIRDVDVKYRREESFSVHVTLESPYGEEPESYSSEAIWDFTLFRHIGILEIDSRPVFDGFYALRLKE